MDDMDTLAQQVHAARKARKWTQAELAQAAGVSEGMVSNFERRKTDPQGPNLRKILAALNLEAAAGDAQASRTRSDFPADVKTFLDMMGLYLTALDDEKREETIYELTRQIVTGR